MRVSALVVCSGLAAMLAGGCAPYRYAYDHRDELHQQDRIERRELPRRIERPRRVAAEARPSTAKQRTSVVAKPQASPTYRPVKQAVVAPPIDTGPEDIQESAIPPSPSAPSASLRATPKADPATVVAPAAPGVAQAPVRAAAKPPAAAPTAPPAPEPPPVAPPSTSTAAATAPSPEARKEIADGYRLLRAGFVKKARERFAAAMPTAAAEATLAEARSMDPSYLSSVAFPDVEPDAEQAQRLYRRALMLGAGEAKSDLERLESASANAARNTPSAQ